MAILHGFIVIVMIIGGILAVIGLADNGIGGFILVLLLAALCMVIAHFLFETSYPLMIIAFLTPVLSYLGFRYIKKKNKERRDEEEKRERERREEEQRREQARRAEEQRRETERQRRVQWERDISLRIDNIFR